VQLGAYALVTGSEDWVYDRWFELMGVKARPVRPLVGYSSWYRHYGDIDQAKLAADFEGAYVGLMDVKLGNAQRVFQVDDGYCKVGDWLRVDAAKFPRGLAPLATRATAAGFLPGLWVSPFVCEAQSWLFAQHPDWLMRDEAGQLVRTGPHWSGAYALDTRNPEVRSYVRQVLQTLTCDWGFRLLKLDFLYAACMVPHDGMNRGELMADAMRLLREAAGEDVLLLGCGVPLASAFGVVDYCRIGCDVGLDWDDKPHMRLLHRERVSTKNSLGNTVSRAPLDGRAFGNDPDVFFLRDDVKFSARHRRELLETDARCGSMLLTSDDMGAWGTAERELFQAAVRTLLSRKR
jgi:alpha-galactosidase